MSEEQVVTTESNNLVIILLSFLTIIFKHNVGATVVVMNSIIVKLQF